MAYLGELARKCGADTLGGRVGCDQLRMRRSRECAAHPEGHRNRRRRSPARPARNRAGCDAQSARAAPLRALLHHAAMRGRRRQCGHFGLSRLSRMLCTRKAVSGAPRSSCSAALQPLVEIARRREQILEHLLRRPPAREHGEESESAVALRVHGLEIEGAGPVEGGGAQQRVIRLVGLVEDREPAEEKTLRREREPHRPARRSAPHAARPVAAPESGVTPRAATRRPPRRAGRHPRARRARLF